MFYYFFFLLIFTSPILYSQQVAIKDSINYKNEKTHYNSYRYAKSLQGIFIQKLNEPNYRGFMSPFANQPGIRYQIGEIDITDPLFGGPSIHLIPITIRSISSSTSGLKNGVIFIQSDIMSPTKQWSIGFDLANDGSSEATIGRSLSDFSGFISSPIVQEGNWSGSLTFSFRRLYSINDWKNHLPIQNFYNDINIQDIPETVRVYGLDPMGGNQLISEYHDTTINLLLSGHQRGNERTQYEYNLGGTVMYNNYTLTYLSLLNYYTGRKEIGVHNLFNYKNRPEFNGLITANSIKLLVQLSDEVSFSIGGNYYQNYSSTFDPRFKHDLQSYGDANKNHSLINYPDSPYYYHKTQFVGLLNQFGFNYNNNFTSEYSKQDQSYIEWIVNSNWKLSPKINQTINISYKYYELRKMNLNAFHLKSTLESPNNLASNLKERTIIGFRQLRGEGYGYDIYGNKFDEGLLGAKKPTEFVVNLQSAFKDDPFLIRIDLAYKQYKPNTFSIQTEKEITYNSSNLPSEKDIDSEKIYEGVFPEIALETNLSSQITFGVVYKNNMLLLPFDAIHSGYTTLNNLIFSKSTPKINMHPVEVSNIELYTIGSNNYLEQYRVNLFFSRYTNMVGYKGYRLVPNGELFSNNSEHELNNVGFEIYSLKRINQFNSMSIGYSFLKINQKHIFNFNNYWHTEPPQPPSDYSTSYHKIVLNYSLRKTVQIPFIGDQQLIEFDTNYLITSGNYYTGTDTYHSDLNFATSPTMSLQTPWNATLSINGSIIFDIQNITVQFYLKAENILNSKTIYQVFPYTGSAENDGFLDSDLAKDQIAIYGQKYAEIYNAVNNQNNPTFFGEPRTITLGMRMNF